jgi:hypothetical protein
MPTFTDRCTQSKSMTKPARSNCSYTTLNTRTNVTMRLAVGDILFAGRQKTCRNSVVQASGNIYEQLFAKRGIITPQTMASTWTILSSLVSTTVRRYWTRIACSKKSGKISDFIAAMDDFCFPTIKCPAGCFAYADQCQ